MEDKRIGKIQQIHFGNGGYDDSMLGVSFTLGSDKDCWGVGDFKGTWGFVPDSHCKWTFEDQTKIWGDTVRYIGQLLKDAKVSEIQKLRGIPVEVIFKDNTLKSWRILTEVI